MSASVDAALSPVRAAMAKTNQLFETQVFGKRNFEALHDVYTADARILPPGASMISGRPAIQEFWSKMIESANAKSAVLTSLEVIQTGAGIVEIGRAKLGLAPDGGEATEVEVKYVVYWQEEDGLWKWHVDIWNQNS